MHTNECDVVTRMCAQARAVWKATERGNTREDRVRLEGSQFPSQRSRIAIIPEYRRHQEGRCTKGPHVDHSMAPGQHHGCHERQQPLRSRASWKRPSFSLQFELKEEEYKQYGEEDELKIREGTINNCGNLEQLCISHHVDELPLGKRLLGKQLGATPVDYVVCRCGDGLPPIG
jgi:hypothetical protein